MGEVALLLYTDSQRDGRRGKDGGLGSNKITLGSLLPAGSALFAIRFCKDTNKSAKHSNRSSLINVMIILSKTH